MKKITLKPLLVNIFLLTTLFTLAQSVPPQNLNASISGGNVTLTWDAPVEYFEIAYDDGDNEGGYQPSNDQYMAVRMTMPEDGDLQEVALDLKSPFGVYDLNDIIVCPDDGFGLPDLTAPHESFGIITIDNSSWEWYIFTLTTPISLLSGVDFWVVAQWPSDLVFPYGAFVAVDDTNPPVEDRNYFTSSSGEWVLLDEDNLMMRAYYLPSTKYYSDGGKNVIQNTDSKEVLKKEFLKSISEIGNQEIIKTTIGQQTNNIITGVDDLIAYNVYRDDILIGYFVSDLTYVDEDLPNGTYDYYVKAVYHTGESNPSNTVQVTIDSAGIEEDFIHNTVIYPNPATDVVNVKSDLQISSISVYSLTGQIIADETVQSNSYQFNTSNLESGFYIFRLQTDKGTINHSVMID